jgi:CDP-glucose 4,6-dehydratase
MKQSKKALQVFDGFYKNKSVLVTGQTGFKGSWLALWLHKLGANVTGYALPPNTEPNHFDLIGLKDLIHHREGDIRDLQTVQATFAESQPEIVFHLAAQPIVRESYDDPKTTFDTNIGGTVNVLEAIRHCPSVKAAVVVTSDKCYENKEWVWGYRENDPMGGHDPYSASKGATEIVCSAYLRSYFQQGARGPHIGFATARAGNVIGGGDWAKDRIIPDCVRALSKGEPIIVRNPNATRPWQHVLDPLSGYLLLAKRLNEYPERLSGPWNFGPCTTDQITVKELAERFISSWGSGKIQLSQARAKAPHEAHLLHLNIDKAAFGLNWQPAWDSSEAIDFTVDWYKSWHSGQVIPITLSLEQIKRFSQMGLKQGVFV